MTQPSLPVLIGYLLAMVVLYIAAWALGRVPLWAVALPVAPLLPVGYAVIRGAMEHTR